MATDCGCSSQADLGCNYWCLRVETSVPRVANVGNTIIPSEAKSMYRIRCKPALRVEKVGVGARQHWGHISNATNALHASTGVCHKVKGEKSPGKLNASRKVKGSIEKRCWGEGDKAIGPWRQRTPILQHGSGTDRGRHENSRGG